MLLSGVIADLEQDVLPWLQDQSGRRSVDGAAQHLSTVDAGEMQQAPALKPLKINKNNFAGLEAQGERLFWCLNTHCQLQAAGMSQY